ncbi:GntR family transcriptional regulator [Cognatiyoonia sp. IB215446]|uniref:GntR family transcriptional regulator n=1 Tax=Cognatiyoonia sp. IB215446 TaxID=3097355 RepID=UPI002A107AB5|nr:GntR family transcriptional regulator [Cognatiyoonia sp. IB215446]MDX8350584.1 GntR family transcriptional regulator [Cognatiyoonia sp. IB215446]
MPSQAQKSKSNSAIAVEELRNLIFSGALPAGSDHLESELAARLGMSRTPVREAALLLEGQGLLQVRARKGVRILPISIEDMIEIYDVLTELESMSAAKAAEKRYAAEDLSTLEITISDMEAALAAGDREAWAAADDAFHTELARLGGNSRVVTIAALMGDQVRRAKAVTLYMRPLPTQSNKDHRSVVEAIRAGDAKTAHDVHYAHRTAAKEVLINLLRQNRMHML